MTCDLVAIGRTSARVRRLPLAAGAAVALASLAPSVLADATWVGNGTAPGNNWNPVSSVNWLGGVGPVSDVTAALNFSQTPFAAVTSTNNIVGTPFQVHTMSFNVENAFTVAWAAGNKFQFANDSTTAPTVSVDGYGIATLASATTAGIELADNLTFVGSGPGTLTLAGPISESGGSHSITIPSTGLLSDLHILYLANAANSFSGGLTIDGGTVGSAGNNAQSFGALAGTITVTSNGGTIANQSSPTIAQTVLQLNGPLHVILGGMTLGNSTTTGSLTNGCLQGTSPLFAELGTILVKSNSGSGSTSPYTGAVNVHPSDLPQLTVSAAGIVTLQSLGTQSNNATGSLNMAASFDVQAGGTLLMDNGGSGVTQNSDRIGDTTPVRIRSGLFQLNGPTAGASAPTSLTENVGDVSGAGEARITVSNTMAAGVIGTLQINSLSRVERGTFTFNGTGSAVSSLGDGATTPRGRIMLTNPLAGTEFVGGGGASLSTNISILPYAVGALSSATDRGSSLVTYGADGFRLLQPAEYFTSTDLDATPAGATDNVRLTTATAHTGTHTINALVIAKNGSNDGSITGTGTLNITSGVVLSAGNTNINNTIANNIAFGGAEGVVTTGLGSMLTLSGNLTGTNGLTKSGGSSAPVVILTNDNSGLTGPLTIDAGSVQVNSAVAVPGTGPIVMNGSIVSTAGNSTGLFSANPTAWTLSRDIAVGTGIMTFKLTNALLTTQANLGSLTVAGAITGIGGVNYQAQSLSSAVTVPGDIFVTNTGNTYTGVTRFAGGNIHVNGEASLGNGGAWEFSGGTMVLENSDLSNSRAINFSGSGSGFNTNGYNLTLNGPITGFNEASLTSGTGAGFNKTGTGTLTLTNNINMIAGPVNVYNGTVLINGVLGPSATNSVFVGTFDAGAHYGTLGGSGTIYRNVTIATGGTLSPGGSNTGILTLYGSLDMGGTAANLVPANLVMQLNGPVAGTAYDQVVSILQNGTGAAGVATVKLGGPTPTPATTPANLVLSLGYAPASADVFWLIVSKSTIGTANLITGAFANQPEGSSITLGTFGGVTYTGLITYNANFETGQLDHSGNDVAIYNISSPNGSCCVLTGGGNGTQCFGGDTAAQCATRGGTFTAGGTCVGAGSCNNGHFCGSADYNCDGDLGTDSDIAAFFACLAGACPALPCISTADFNGDGDLGTDTDIEAFFRVLSGGSC